MKHTKGGGTLPIQTVLFNFNVVAEFESELVANLLSLDGQQIRFGRELKSAMIVDVDHEGSVADGRLDLPLDDDALGVARNGLYGDDEM